MHELQSSVFVSCCELPFLYCRRVRSCTVVSSATCRCLTSSCILQSRAEPMVSQWTLLCRIGPTSSTTLDGTKMKHELKGIRSPALERRLGPLGVAVLVYKSIVSGRRWEARLTSSCSWEVGTDLQCTTTGGTSRAPRPVCTRSPVLVDLLLVASLPVAEEVRVAGEERWVMDGCNGLPRESLTLLQSDRGLPRCRTAGRARVEACEARQRS